MNMLEIKNKIKKCYIDIIMFNLEEEFLHGDINNIFEKDNLNEKELVYELDNEIKDNLENYIKNYINIK